MTWTIRPYAQSDEAFCVDAWLTNFARSRYGRALGAHVERSSAEYAFRDAFRGGVMRALDTEDTRVLCMAADPIVVLGFACTGKSSLASASPPRVLHMAAVKRRFHHDGISADLYRAMLGDWLDGPVVCTREQVDLAKAMPIPAQWILDPYWSERTAA